MGLGLSVGGLGSGMRVGNGIILQVIPIIMCNPNSGIAPNKAKSALIIQAARGFIFGVYMHEHS